MLKFLLASLFLITAYPSNTTIGTGIALASGVDIGDALSQGLNGAATGAATGFSTDAVIGYAAAKSQGRNPWTGQEKAVRTDSKSTEQNEVFNDKKIASVNKRTGRDGNAVELVFEDGSKMDINNIRVKEWIPPTDIRAPVNTLQRVKFDNYINGSKGYKRIPSNTELNFLNNIFK